jgi:hypothetical protein
MLLKAFVVTIAIALPSSVSVQRVYAASGGGCVLVADKGEVWMHVFQETGNSEKGQQIYDIHLQKGDTQKVDPQPNDRIRYDYKNSIDDDYHGNVGATCRDGQQISVP